MFVWKDENKQKEAMVGPFFLKKKERKEIHFWIKYNDFHDYYMDTFFSQNWFDIKCHWNNHLDVGKCTISPTRWRGFSWMCNSMNLDILYTNKGSP